MTTGSYFGSVWLVRLLLQRALGAIYFVAFLSALLQFPALLGERGLLSVPEFVRRARFRDAPSLFVWRYSDRLFRIVAWIGLLGSVVAVSGVYEGAALWLVMWAIDLSIVNVGQTFYAFGWESMLLEAGFFAAFLGTTSTAAPLIPVLILRWMLFRTELGAGLIKLRHDQCWRNLTCLYWHYETQPLPNPTSWFFHRQPKFLHRFAVLFSHFVQVIVPFGLFAPQPYASIAGALTIFHQLWLIVSGNYSWLNWLTVVLGISAFSDQALPFVAPAAPPPGPVITWTLIALAAATALLSIKPVLNLFARHQLMNYSYNRFHIVNTYGAFGSVTKERYEIAIEGTDDATGENGWQEYGFRAKPGDPRRMPPQVAPYHLRLDWLMWFLPFSVRVTPRGLLMAGYELWFVRFMARLLEGDRATLGLLRRNPFREHPPALIRALYYRYRFTTWRERRESGAWWTRELAGVYLRAVSLRDVTAVLRGDES
jgi:hypothetical protein